jgi:hypothetical protein
VAVRGGQLTQPLIGAGFLSHYSLLVDCRNNRLLDGVTSLSVPAQAARSLVPSVKIITGGSAIDSLLSEFPDLIHPTGDQREVRHRTVHCVTPESFSGLVHIRKSEESIPPPS